MFLDLIHPLAALIFPQVGINYRGTTSELAGCINDVKNIQNFIICQYNCFSVKLRLTNLLEAQYGYKKEDIVMLTDDATNPRQKPTRENIVGRILFYFQDLCLYYQHHYSFKLCNGWYAERSRMTLSSSIVSIMPIGIRNDEIED